MPVKTSVLGRNLIIRAEGFRSDAYLCSAGVPTIGYGSIRYQDRDKVQLGDTISRNDAEALLTHYIATQIDPMVPRLITRPLTQPQWDAFASFLYNFGFEKTRGYSLTQLINDGPEGNSLDDLRAWETKLVEKWPVYRMAGGKALLGLFRRRVAELLTFLHLPADVAWTLPHMGVDLIELVANMRAGKPTVSEPKLAPPVGTPFIPPMPAEAPPAPAPEPVLETVTAQPKENPVMSDLPEAKPALKSKTIWGVLILVMAPFVAQIGDALQVAGSTAPSAGDAIAGVMSTAMTFTGAILATIGRMAAGQPLK
jgi:lysozyme